MSDLYKDYLMHSNTGRKGRYKKNPRTTREIDTGVSGRLANAKKKHNGSMPERSPIEEAQRRNWTAQRKEETRKHEEDAARQERAYHNFRRARSSSSRASTPEDAALETQVALIRARDLSDAYANTGNYNTGSRRAENSTAVEGYRLTKPQTAGARARSDAAANSGRYNTGNRMFSSFPNAQGRKSSESFWNSILSKARNNGQLIRMMTPNGEMSMSPEYWEELFGNGENAAGYTYLGMASRNNGSRPLR